MAKSSPAAPGLTDVELDAGRLGSRRFACLCNAVIHASTYGTVPGQPVFTQRTDDPDGGVDAEWTVQKPDLQGARAPFLKPGWNVFQYKLVDVSSMGRPKALASLKRRLLVERGKGKRRRTVGAIADLHERDPEARWPAHYILFTTLDLGPGRSAARRDLTECCRRGLPPDLQIKVTLVGAGELGAYLDSLPHLRGIFFGPELFDTWRDAMDRLLRVKSRPEEVEIPFIGRDELLSQIRADLENTSVRAVILAGPNDVGKSNLALEALRPNAGWTIAVNRRSGAGRQPIHVRDLLVPNEKTFLLVEDPTAEELEGLLEDALAQKENFCLVVTFPTRVVRISSSRVRVHDVSELEEKDARKLLAAAAPSLDSDLADHVVRQAGGSPGAILAAASVGESLRLDTSFFRQAAEVRWGRLQRHLNSQAQGAARLLSLLRFVGVTGEPETELQALASAFDLNPLHLAQSISALRDAGAVQIVGRYVEVVPLYMARLLAEQALIGGFRRLLRLYSALEAGARQRLLQRLSEIEGDEAERFWNALIGHDSLALVADLSSATLHSETLRLGCIAQPERVVPLLTRWLAAEAVSERKRFVESSKSQLAWSLVQGLGYTASGVAAFKGLALCAEVESGDGHRVAADAFSSSFYPTHPQVALPLPERLGVLLWAAEPARSEAVNLLAVEACQSALRNGTTLTLDQSSGGRPFEGWPIITWGEYHEYLDGAAATLYQLSSSANEVVRTKAAQVLPNSLYDLFCHGRHETTLRYLEQCITRLMTGDLETAPCPGRMEDTLLLCLHALPVHVEHHPSEAAVAQSTAVKLERLLQNFDQAPFEVSLHRWTFSTRRDFFDGTSKGPWDKRTSVARLTALAEDAVRNPELFSDTVLLRFAEKRGIMAGMFVGLIGAADRENALLDYFVTLSGKCQPEQFNPVASYLFGVRRRDQAFAAQAMESLLTCQQLSASTVFGAVLNFPPSQAIVEWVMGRLSDAQSGLDTITAVNSAIFAWRDHLANDDCLRLLSALIDHGERGAAAIIHSLDVWLYAKKEIEEKLRDLAWRAIDQIPAGVEEYEFLTLAGYLARQDRERGMRLLLHILSQVATNRRDWSDFGLTDRNPLWEALVAGGPENKKSTILAVLQEVARQKKTRGFGLGYGLRDELDILGTSAAQEAANEFARCGEQEGEIVAEMMRLSLPLLQNMDGEADSEVRTEAFLHLTDLLLEHYPDNDEIRTTLMSETTELWGQVVVGPRSAALQKRLKSIVGTKSKAKSPRTRLLISEAEQDLKLSTERHRQVEIEEPVRQRTRENRTRTAKENAWVSALLGSLVGAVAAEPSANTTLPFGL